MNAENCNNCNNCNCKNRSLKNFDQFRLESITSNNTSSKVLGYYVYSTAPINVEEYPKCDPKETEQKLKEITNNLVGENAEIVISIHGYANKECFAKAHYQKINQYAKDNFSSKRIVFLGYIWPSEKPFTEGLNAINALPFLLQFLSAPFGLFLLALFFSPFLSKCETLLTFLTHSRAEFSDFLILVIFAIFALIFAISVTLALLRLLTYFRDSYRATNYGIPDLVELLQWINHFVSNKNSTLQENTIKLSFIGHSMGCFVATNTIRILSDVFADGAITEDPGTKIGKVFCLERLVLVAPDIPIQTIMSGRANFLRSSLRRCKEAYVFSNEGDLGLRLGSTIANYFSFPAKKIKSGYRLGNITVKEDKAVKEDKKYGIINIDDTVSNLFDQLEMRVIFDKDGSLEFLGESSERKMIANKFTYFDCTDYVDSKGIPEYQENTKKDGIVSFAKKKSCLNFFDYIFLVIAHFIKIPREIDTHGGYFKGSFSQKLIYDLAFVGFQEMLKMETYSQKNFSDCCKEKQIKVIKYMPTVKSVS
ncbi:MAG: alpha/beta hydrolase [Aphanizomenon sp.]|jgi:hypothetical protein